MLFKSREGGIWVFGRKRTTPETDSQWAFNPLSFRWGFVCFDDQNKPTERMVSISQPKPDVTTLPDLGFPWQEQRAADMRCLSGADAGASRKPARVRACPDRARLAARQPRLSFLSCENGDVQ